MRDQHIVTTGAGSGVGRAITILATAEAAA
jgi:NAD(P)-dependent dehydrogenase (short-subunit alcohol dehydrogenase family)